MSNTDEPGGSKAATEATRLPGAGRPTGTATATQSAASGAPGAAGTAGSAARPAGRPATSRPLPRRSSPRRVRLTVSRVDPWSVMKIAFLLSVAVAIACVVVTVVLWVVLDGMGVFSSINDLLRNLDREGSTFNLMDYIGLGRVLSLAVVIGVIDIVLMTAIATLMAFLYNICASLVGGVQLTLSDE